MLVSNIQRITLLHNPEEIILFESFISHYKNPLQSIVFFPTLQHEPPRIVLR